MNKELLQQALDALIGVLDDAKDLRNASISGGLYEVIECRDAIAALRKAIAQTVQPISNDEIEAAVLAERSACAILCEARYMGDNNREDMEARRCAAMIRARTI